MNNDAKIFLDLHKDDIEDALNRAIHQRTISYEMQMRTNSILYKFADGSAIVKREGEHMAYNSGFVCIDGKMWEPMNNIKLNFGSVPSEMTLIQNKKVKIPFEWEYIGDETSRAKVVGGWMVSIKQESLCFIPDPEHLWEIEQ